MSQPIDITGSQNSAQIIPCPQCSRPCKGKLGLSIHRGKSHAVTYHSQPTTIPATDTPPPPLTPSLPQTTPPSSKPEVPLWKTLSSLKRSKPTVKRVPQGARISVARSLSSVIRKVIIENSAPAWKSLMLFAYNVLHVGQDHNSHNSLTQCIKLNSSSYDIQAPAASPSVQPQVPQRRPPPTVHRIHPSNAKNVFEKVEDKVSEGDVKGASQLLFSNDTVAPDSAETLSGLASKHPSPTATSGLPDPPQPTSDTPPPQATEKDTRAAIMSFRSGSAGGADGLTPQHIKDLIEPRNGDAGKQLLGDITQLINLLLTGKVNPEILTVLYGANLCALNKKDGGIRPIAMGSTLRRIASKICCKHIISTLKQEFQPLQLGFGSKGGCEAAVHALRTYLQNDGGELILKIDVKNAFNSVDRRAMLQAVKQKTPEIYPYVYQCYYSPTNLIYRDHVLDSAVGCQQGDPLGPAIFSLAIHPTVSALSSKLNMWYLDDGTLGGDPQTVLSDLVTIVKEFQLIGLELNFAKCELYLNNNIPNNERSTIISQFSSVCPGIKILTNESLRLLGAPILEESIPSFINDQHSKFKESSDRLTKISSHMAFQIIRFCLFVPKFTYALRCCPFWKYVTLLKPLDQAIQNTLIEILNCPLSERSWNQGSLPVRFGGLGIRKVSQVALPAFLSSAHSTLSLFQQIVNPSLGSDTEISMCTEAREAWLTTSASSSYPEEPQFQRNWDEPLCKLLQTELTDSSSSPTERARLLAVAERESGTWLQALPSTHTGTLLDNNTFTLAVGLRLGCRISSPHLCICGQTVDELGHHALSCRRSAGRQTRHTYLNDVIRRALATLNVPALLEPNGLARDDGKRPDGMTIIPWRQGRVLVWDATCSDTLAPSYITSTSRTAGAAAEMAEHRKRKKYAHLGTSYEFLPFAVETMGTWGEEAKEFSRLLCEKIVKSTGDKRAGSYYRQRISLAIQRGNAACLLDTLAKGVDNLPALFF